MKLSVSAYRAHASAHKKILDTAYQLNYGSTSAHHPATGTSATCAPFQLDPPILDAHGNVIPGGVGLQQSTAASLGLGGPIDEGGSSDDARTPLQSPRSQNTSREEEDESSNANESDCKSPSQRGVDSPPSAASSAGLKWRPLERRQRRRGAITSRDGDDEAEVDEDGDDGPPTKQAVQGWRNLRAVMAYYHSLRKIKRTKSNQRWMKLRTTVQISSAIQKKPPLKREDSFLQRFASRHQIPEAQETVEDTGSEGGGKGGVASGGGAGEAGCIGPGGRRRRHRRGRQPRTVVNPDENFYFHWLLVLTVSVLYNMWTLIVRQSFPELQQMMSTFWFLCDSSSDLFFVSDVVVQLRTGYLEQGLMVYDGRKLARHYVASRAFLLDLAALCPLDLLQIRLGTQPLLRFPRFLKVYRAVNYYYMVESRTVYPNLWRVVNLIHILLILAHWFGCFYFLLSEAEGFQGDWVYPYRPGDYATLTRKYLGSLYWSTLTLTTIGDLPTPETNAEDVNSVDGPRSLPRRGIKSRLLQFNTSGGYVFTIVSYLIGVFIFATIVGQVGNVITNRNANRLEFERLLDGAKTYMRHHKVPGGMKRRVLRWYDYSWSRGRIQGGGDINTALGLLPDKLKTELALHVNLTVLKKVTIFQECQPEFLRDLVLKMKAYIFTPGDSICRKGEVAREMFIIADGILEVISEAGKILTTMKAGDFFGEIGILNLDGLNKRTADVRSVGYSELFSLSREDVLNAMKDYPEAQEILQALGRKRLMEVKASARQHAKEMKDRADAKGLVDKIKSEAKRLTNSRRGLRNALRKTRTAHARRSQEELEMQPLHPNATNLSKGMLRRMPRVRSHDLSQEEQQPLAGEQEKPEEKVSSPLGAGLPLLSRLRLLKEKQEHEERLTNCTTPSMLSPSPAASIKSPPPTTCITTTESSTTTTTPQPTEIIGAGLPLLQRLLLLKATEDRLLPDSQSQPTSPQPAAVSSTSLRTRTSFSVPTSGGTARSSISSTASARNSLSVTPSVVTKTIPPSVKPSAKVTFRERLSKLHPPKDVKDTKAFIKKALLQQQQQQDVQPTSANIQPSEITPSSTSSVVLPPSQAPLELSPPPPPAATSFEQDDNNAWLKLKKAAIVQQTSDNATSSSSKSDQHQVSETPPTVVTQRTKPSLVLTSKHKQYRSIDDLSPEYGGLPFVKKLKILNERIKLEELETVMKTRSFSLDIPEAAALEVDNLTRSQSEGSSMHRGRGGTVGKNGKPDGSQGDLLGAKLISGSELHSSTESNETLERRQLRSILKKLSEETTPASTICATIDGAEFRRLMRAPTIEGYAARHSKLAKSVTFNRDTLQSPPGSGNNVQQQQQQQQQQQGDASSIQSVGLELREERKEQQPPPQQRRGGGRGMSRDNVFQFPVNVGNGGLDVLEQQRKGSVREEFVDGGVNHNSRELVSRDMKMIKGSLEEDQQYFADILFAIKQVMSSHLQDIQDKYHLRCEELQRKLKEKNETIEELRAHITDLEHGGDDSFTDSMETIISGPHSTRSTSSSTPHLVTATSWEATSHYESHDLSNLSHQTTLTPKPLWHPPEASSTTAHPPLPTSPPPPNQSTTRVARGGVLDRSVSSCCILDMDSNTDTDGLTDEEDDDEEVGELMESPIDRATDDDEEEEYENSSTNWEMELLAAELRASRRSVSLDQPSSASQGPRQRRSSTSSAAGRFSTSGAGGSIHRRFVRGNSCRD